MNDDQAKRYEEVRGWPVEDRRRVLSALQYVVDGTKTASSTPWRIATVCPVIQEYVLALGLMLGEDYDELWKSDRVLAVFGTENTALVKRRVQMMIGCLGNCAKRVAEVVPAQGGAAGGTPEWLENLVRNSGVQAIGMALFTLPSKLKLDDELEKSITAATTAWNKMTAARHYEPDPELNLKDLLGELRRGSFWLLSEMAAMRP